MISLPKYSDNTSYRLALRTVIGMQTPEYVHSSREDDIDEETADEQYYDETYMATFLDSIYLKTKDHALFKELYEIAAGKMLSLNPEIGLAVLLSYDYLALFYRCVQEYSASPESFTNTNKAYMAIKHKIT